MKPFSSPRVFTLLSPPPPPPPCPVMAAVSIANIVKTSLGPVGLDKMLVDDVGVSVCWASLVVCSLCSDFLFDAGETILFTCRTVGMAKQILEVT